MRLLNSFKIEKHDEIDCHPITGNLDPTRLVAMPRRYKAIFTARDPKAPQEAMMQRIE
ncbi:hypothetical protein NW754_009528 [Fusarium falciforme]|nr:hypothetical protein NW754_009528 [Fusarium falciforme]